MRVRNDLFDARRRFTLGRSRRWFALWYAVKVLVFDTPVPMPSRVRRRILTMFGARIGPGFYVRPNVNIHLPWRFAAGSNCWIGEGTTILNLARVTLGDNVALAHEVYLAAAGHDITSPSMEYKNRPITIGDGAWIATRAYIGPGVTIGEHAVVAAGAVVVKDVEAFSIVGGNPARRIGTRVLRG